MAYKLYIPEPATSKKRRPIIELKQLLGSNSSQIPRCIIKGAVFESTAYAGNSIMAVEAPVHWRGDMARNWFIHYLRHFEKVSDVFLSREVGISDPAMTAQSLQGKKYRLPIVGNLGFDLSKNGNELPCVWYGLNDEELKRWWS